ncbi:FAD-dependent oxidoreductase [Streptomyces noursei]
MKFVPDARPPLRVVVLGGGYAGMMAALRLAPYARITLVDPSDRFTERVRMHELVAGRPDVTHSRAQLLHGTGIEHVAARATVLDPEARALHTDTGRTLLYDRLVYALGSHTAPVKADERLYTAEKAAALRARLDRDRGALAVVGGGLTGIEMAGGQAVFAVADPVGRSGYWSCCSAGVGFRCRPRPLPKAGRSHSAGFSSTGWGG